MTVWIVKLKIWKIKTKANQSDIKVDSLFYKGYLRTLKKDGRELYSEKRTITLQLDNTLPHYGVTKTYLDKETFLKTNYQTACSRDLNSIELVWSDMKG